LVNNGLVAELVVIGGGASGLAAAVRARELGVENVIVLEKTHRPGGNAWLAVVMLGLGERSEPDDDMTSWRDDTFASLMTFRGWMSNPRLIGAYVDTYPDVVRWLIGKGMRFVIQGFDFGGRRFTTLAMKERKGNYKVTEPSRGPGFVGSTATDLLYDDCRTLGVAVLAESRATSILLDESGTRVRGVTVSGPAGDLLVNTQAVVLAAGGFGANEEMLRSYFPHHFAGDGPISTLCLGSSTGDGLVMARELGLEMGEDMESGIIGPSHHPWSHSIHETVHRPEMLWINADGERFTNESLSIAAGRVLAKQPGGFLWALFDARTRDYMMTNPSARQITMAGENWLRTLRHDLEKEAAWKRRTVGIADSLGSLAQKIGASAETLRITVARYNALSDQGRDSDFTKPAQFLKPLRTPPFYAVLGVRFCHGTSGGVKVNERMEATGRDGRQIGGLYATGDNTSGWVSDISLPGTTLGFAFTSGYIAGEQAAKRLRR
jgi:fumarate reductase flavoprotein subunit